MPASPFVHLDAIRAVLDGVADHPAAIRDREARSVFPAPVVTTGALLWPAAHAHRVLHEWAEWTRTLPASVTSVARLVRYPRRHGIPHQLRGRAFVAVEVAIPGEPWVALGRLAPLRRLSPEIDTVVASGPSAVHPLHVRADLPPRAVGCHIRLRDLTPAAIDAFLTAAGPTSGSTLVTAELRHGAGRYAVSAAGRACGEDDAESLHIRLGLLEERLAEYVDTPAPFVASVAR